MNDTRASLEVIAPSVEEAISKGLGDLGLTESEVDIEVLDSGSKGLFGLGSRQARVRLTIKGSSSASAIPPRPAPASAPGQPSVVPLKSAEELEAGEEVELGEEDQAEFEPQLKDQYELEEEDEFALQVARETIEELLEKMKVRADVSAHYGEPDDERSRVPLKVDVHGKDLSILIGPRAETLNALQYIAALIVGKELGRSVPLVVDVEGYRARREQQIRQLARRMADQAIKTGRRQVLEPMPASERRLVHIELRSNPAVTTESIGEDPRRKVTIIPVD
jgi:spoIIIJ-associated protein